MYYVYKITNNINNKVYIGKTNNLAKRFKQHVSKRNKHVSIIKRAIQKHGEKNFSFEKIYEHKDEAVIIAKEYEFINSLNTLLPNGYNILNRQNERLSFDESTKKKLSNSVQRSSVRRGKSSQYRGVTIINNRAYLTCIGKDRNIINRSFKTERTAAEAYDKVKIYCNGLDAAVNFPQKMDYYKKIDLAIFYNKLLKNKKVYPNKFKYIINRGNKWYVTHSKFKIREKLVIGSFETDEQAAETADKLIIYYNLLFELNFPTREHNRIENDIILFKQNAGNTSSEKGVMYIRSLGKWRVNLLIDKKRTHIGTYDSEKQAIDGKMTFLQKRTGIC
ncbi:MAG: Enterococcus phage [Bacteroidota bacterium]|jgi:group I intron endonuclease